MDFDTLKAATTDQIWDALRDQVKPGRSRQTPLEEAAGCVLTADVRSTHDFPPFDRAVMDGYAVRVSDFADGMARLRNDGLIRAGELPVDPVEKGACFRINTGAPMPASADAVVCVEHSSEDEDDFVLLNDSPEIGQYVNRRASLLKKGDLMLRAGTRLGGSALSALVAAGVTHVDVFTRPRVALLTTGHELVEHGRELQDGQIHDSNSTALEEYIRLAGGEIDMFGRCPDMTSALRASLELGLAHDLLCVTGGMSKGTHDLVPNLLEDLGVRWLVSGARLKPGKPLRIGRSESGCWVVGLPGNPVSCAVGFLLFTRGILKGLQGSPVVRPTHLAGMLDENMPPNGRRAMYQPATWSADSKGALHVSPVIWRGSGDPFGMAIANALICRDPEASAAQRGETVRFIALDLPR